MQGTEGESQGRKDPPAQDKAGGAVKWIQQGAVRNVEHLVRMDIVGPAGGGSGALAEQRQMHQ